MRQLIQEVAVIIILFGLIGIVRRIKIAQCFCLMFFLIITLLIVSVIYSEEKLQYHLLRSGMLILTSYGLHHFFCNLKCYFNIEK